jgi:hypothetical protein
MQRAGFIIDKKKNTMVENKNQFDRQNNWE